MTPPPIMSVNTTAAEKQVTRRKPVQRQRGAAVFIVVLTILLLSALGTWAMHSASLVNRASGFNRAAMQTQYVSEMGMLATTGLLSVPGFAEANIKNDTDACFNVTTSGTDFCKSFFLEDITAQTSDLTGASLTDAVNDEGSFGPYGQEMQGYFRVEVTDPVPVAMAGNDIGSAASVEYRRYTLTSYGTVRPWAGVADGNSLCLAGTNPTTAENSAAGRIGMRAHAVLGPFTK